MRNIHDLLNQMATEEAAFADVRFVAPCVAGGRVRARVAGVVQTFVPDPPDFTGWGIFQAREDKAKRLEEADLPTISTYLQQFPLLRLRLTRPLHGQTWLAYPMHEADMRQRFGEARPVVVHLVEDGALFEPFTARNVGGGWWFEQVDRRADPMPTEYLNATFQQAVEVADLRFSGLTPEMRTAYDLATQGEERFALARQQRRAEELQREAQEHEAQLRRAEQQYREEHGYNAWEAAHGAEYDARWQEQNVAAPNPLPAPNALAGRQNRRNRRQFPQQGDEARLREALETGGGALRSFRDRGEYYLVEWTTANGERHTSAVARHDLTVISSGICLSGRDRDFDLQSLIGVIDQRGY